MLHIEQGLASALYVQTGLLGALLTAAMGAPAWASAGLLLASWLCALGFGWAVRSGWSQRFAEPMLLSAQAALMLLVGALHYLLLDRYRALGGRCASTAAASCCTWARCCCASRASVCWACR